MTITQQAKEMDKYITDHYVLGFDVDALYGSRFAEQALSAYIEQQLRQREDVGWHEAEQAILDYNGDTLFDTFRNELLIQIRARKYSTLNQQEDGKL